MRIFFALLVALLVTPATAADLRNSLKDGSGAVMSKSWTGLSIGVLGGCGTGSIDTTVKQEHPANYDDIDESGKPIETEPAYTESFNIDGLAFRGCSIGIQTGYDVQVASDWVIGIGAEYQLSNSGFETSYTVDGATLGKLTVDKDNAWMAYARAGRLMGPDTLAYVLGGYGQVNANAALRLGDDTLSTDQTFDVWTVGAGIEHRITNMVSLKLEYRHMFYDGKTYDTSLEVKPSEDIGLVGISWRIQ